MWYADLLEKVLQSNGRAAPRGMGTRFIKGPCVFTIDDPTQVIMCNPTRRWNWRFGLIESAWILAGRNDVATVSLRNKRMKDFTDPGDPSSLWGAYGPRLAEQLPHVVSSITRDLDTRQAVVTTWRPMVTSFGDDHGGAVWDGSSWRTKDVPCTVAWHFQVVDGCLDLTVFMRSNDVWLGTPYDVFSFTTAQRLVARLVDVPVGRYHHVASNMHLYDSNYEAARQLLEDPSGIELCAVPSLDGWYAAEELPDYAQCRADLNSVLDGKRYSADFNSVLDGKRYSAVVEYLDSVAASVTGEANEWLAAVSYANGR